MKDKTTPVGGIYRDSVTTQRDLVVVFGDDSLVIRTEEGGAPPAATGPLYGRNGKLQSLTGGVLAK